MKVNALGTVSWTQSWFLPFLWEGNNISDSFNFAFAPKGLQLKAQGCRFCYPGERKQSTTLQPHRGYDPLCSCRLHATALRLKLIHSAPRVTEAATLSFEP